MKDLVIVPDASGEVAGVVSWWKLSGAVHWARIAEVCEDLDWPEKHLLDLPGKHAVLKRALHKVFRGARTLIRTMPGSKGYTIVEENWKLGDVPEEQDPRASYETVLQVVFDEDQPTSINIHGTRPGDADSAALVFDHYRKSASEITSDDLSSWVTDQAWRLKAVKLRETGGIYFLPKEHMAEWEKFGNVLRTATPSKIYSLPCLRTGEAVEAILSAVNDEAEQLFGRLQDQDKEEDDKRGKRFYRSRIERCDEMGAKIKTYEQLLGKKMKALRKRFQEMQAAASAALLTIEDDDAKGNSA